MRGRGAQVQGTASGCFIYCVRTAAACCSISKDDAGRVWQQHSTAKGGVPYSLQETCRPGGKQAQRRCGVIKTMRMTTPPLLSLVGSIQECVQTQAGCCHALVQRIYGCLYTALALTWPRAGSFRLLLLCTAV
jgi:hypothetical protein